MAKFAVQKLIRHHKMDEHGVVYQSRVLVGEELTHALCEKLMEEASEVVEAQNRDEMVKEIADVIQALHDIMFLADINQHEVDALVKERLTKLGSYSEGIWAETVTVQPGNRLYDKMINHPEKYPLIEE